MMKVVEYAKEIGKEVSEILAVCKMNNLDYITDENSILNEADIIELDMYFSNEEKEIAEENASTIDNSKKSGKKPNYRKKEKLQTNVALDEEKFVVFRDNMTVSEFSENLGVPANEVIKKLVALGIMANVNNALEYETAELIAVDYNKELKKEETLDISNFEEFEIVDNESDLQERPPVVTIMGHVDHGKTTLLDTIRKTNVVEQEAGGITQAISAYQIKYQDKKITFIDTPGHAAFTAMRSRGAQVTDIVIIIVAADDGIMPQTKEAIDHAKAANVPIIVAINKIDKPGVSFERVQTELSNYGLVPDNWGGDTLYNNISALKNEGINELLENILLISEMNNYQANPNRYAVGTVLESKLDKALGSTATLLIQNGTLRIGDPIVVGTCFGKVRTIRDDNNQEINQATPAQPVMVTGLNDTPAAGDKFMAFEKEKEARKVWEERKLRCSNQQCDPKSAITLDEVFSKIKDEGIKAINIIIKTDVQGSAEAIKAALEKIEIGDVKVKVIRSSVGAVTEGDIVLAKASGAIIIAFNVRPSMDIKNCAKEHNVDIRLHNIIYKVIEEIEDAMKGMLDPEFEEKVLGTAEVRKIFKFSKVGIIAGSYVSEGIIKNQALCRIIRDDIVLYEGKISSIQREKNTVKEVKKGLECGITIENFNDIKENDIIEAYEMIQLKR